MTVSSSSLSPAELSYLHTSLSSHPPIRPDSRIATDFRPLNAETSVLPNTMGSAHVGFADGREAVVGVRAEAEKTTNLHRRRREDDEGGVVGVDIDMTGDEGDRPRQKPKGSAAWVTLGLTLPGMRDDDKDLVFLEEMLRETLVMSSWSQGSTTEPQAQSLQDALVINHRWHWHLYIDVILISAPDQATSSSSSSSGPGLANHPLPLLSMAIHLALRDTRLPRLKSEGDEDPLADDDWDAAVFLYSRSETRVGHLPLGFVPPVTLLVMVVAENVIFDPSSTELKVADGVLAVSVAQSQSLHQPAGSSSVSILATRTLETPARDTMKGVPRDAVDGVDNMTGSGTDQVIPGVWKPKVGGIKRAILTKVVKAVVGGGIGREVLDGLNGFLEGA